MADKRPGKSPEWLETARPVTRRMARMLTLGELSARTGLPADRIMTAVLSRAHSGQRAKLRALARPRWVHNDTEPLWGEDQIGEYFADLARLKRASEEWSSLPEVTQDEAVAAQLCTFAGLERVAGIPKTTSDRWKRLDTFPLPVAAMYVGVPARRLLYAWRRTEQAEIALRKIAQRSGLPDASVAVSQITVAEWLERHNQPWLTSHPGTNLTADVVKP